jgi:hypothetical protein
MNFLLCKALKNGLLLFMVVSMMIFSIPILSIAESAGQKESKEEDPESIDGLTMLYVGGALAGVGALAIALGSSSSSSGPDTPPPEPGSPSVPDSPSEPDFPSLPDPPSDPSTNPPVGPDLNGTNWTGFLEIKDSKYRGYQAISATIVHSGSSLQINTSSTLQYGQQYNGTISSGGYISVVDSATGQTWTTFRNNAYTRRVDLYDWVNNFKDLDRMKLSR